MTAHHNWDFDKWDRRFMEVAAEIATWSKDPSCKIGVVLTKNRKIVATGYNGFPGSIADDDRWKTRETKYPLVIHAEMNALLQAGRDANGSTLYLFGMPGPPCQNCTKHVIQAGIVRIVTRAGVVDEPHWSGDLQRALDTVYEAEILYTTVEMDR